jgi:hypothetical protein
MVRYLRSELVRGFPLGASFLYLACIEAMSRAEDGEAYGCSVKYGLR